MGRLQFDDAALSNITTFFASLTQDELARYNAQWLTVGPQCYLETFDRWLFSFCSVHTSWRANIAAYLACREWFDWHHDRSTLRERLAASRAGMHNQRARYISRFTDVFWRKPSEYYKQENESWTEYRDRLVWSTLGLGKTKVSFALELMYPLVAEVVCLDTHLFQFYGLSQRKHFKWYSLLEQDWVTRCRAAGVPCPIARAIYWDRKQKQIDSSYWTYVFNRG